MLHYTFFASLTQNKRKNSLYRTTSTIGTTSIIGALALLCFSLLCILHVTASAEGER